MCPEEKRECMRVEIITCGGMPIDAGAEACGCCRGCVLARAMSFGAPV